jgi:hypothetical protein
LQTHCRSFLLVDRTAFQKCPGTVPGGKSETSHGYRVTIWQEFNIEPTEGAMDALSRALEERKKGVRNRKPT